MYLTVTIKSLLWIISMLGPSRIMVQSISYLNAQQNFLMENTFNEAETAMNIEKIYKLKMWFFFKKLTTEMVIIKQQLESSTWKTEIIWYKWLFT